METEPYAQDTHKRSIERNVCPSHILPDFNVYDIYTVYRLVYNLIELNGEPSVPTSPHFLHVKKYGRYLTTFRIVVTLTFEMPQNLICSSLWIKNCVKIWRHCLKRFMKYPTNNLTCDKRQDGQRKKQSIYRWRSQKITKVRIFNRIGAKRFTMAVIV